MRGDEYQKFAITVDGYSLVNDNNEWWYAKLSDNGNIEKSSFRLMAEEDETAELKSFKSNCPKGIVSKQSKLEESNAGNRVVKSGNVTPREPAIGERHALVILMQYTDLKFRKTKEEFEELFNTIDYRSNGAKGSVRDYYRFASQQQLDYISDIYGPYTSQYAMRYYGSNSTIGGNDLHPLDLCIEAVKNLPSDIDYTKYDNDGDGVVDNVHIIYAGFGEEAGASSNAIWAHEYPHQINLKKEVGYSIAGYSCSPELRGFSGSNITYIGVICHELGHALGANDYYDTNYENGGRYNGTGQWDIMANGSWNDDGRTPANFNPYVRSNVYGWNEQIVLEPNQQVVLPKMELDNAEESVIYKMETGSEGDYFLLENRQQYRFDEALPGAGLMIYHVHPNIDIMASTNAINATHPQGLYPVCASYSEPGKMNYGDINSAGCSFPGSKNIRNFSSESSPAALAWDGSSAKVAISDIKNLSDGSISFKTTKDGTITPDNPEIPVDKGVIYNEGFETSIENRITITSIMGKEIWRTYKKGDAVIKAELIPQPTEGEKIFMLFSGKGGIINESVAVGEEIAIDNTKKYVISFDIYSNVASASINPYFKFSFEDEYGEYSIYTLNEPTDKWRSIEVPLVFAGNSVRYKLYGRTYSGGVYIDNMRLYKEEAATSIVDLDTNIDNDDIYLYRLDGTFIGKYDIHNKRIASGLYIIRRGEKKNKVMILN